MALTGLHVVCAHVVAQAPYPQIARALWSETLASASTTQEFNGDVSEYGHTAPAFHVHVAVDAFCAVGPVPNASTGPRVFVPAGGAATIYAKRGDKLAWVAA